MTTENQTDLAFVYGTLKKGFGNHRVMEYAGGELLGESSITGATMYSLGAFPGLIFDDNPNQIQGEVYRIQDIKPLDRLEGFPNFYNRRIVETNFGPAWVYYLNNENPSNLRKVESGIWA